MSCPRSSRHHCSSSYRDDQDFALNKETFAGIRYVISAYTDEASVFEGQIGASLAPDRYTDKWKQIPEMVPYLGKVGMFNVWLLSMKLAIWVPDSISSAVATQRFDYDEVR